MCQAILKSNYKVAPCCTLHCLHLSDFAPSSIVKQSKHDVFDRSMREKLSDSMTAMSSKPVDDPSSVFDEKDELYEDEQHPDINLPEADRTDASGKLVGQQSWQICQPMLKCCCLKGRNQLI